MAAGLLEHGMIGVQRGADREAFISGRGLDVGAAKRRVVEELAVGDTVEGAASGHGEVVERNVLVQMIQQVKENFFKTMLKGER